MLAVLLHVANQSWVSLDGQEAWSIRLSWWFSSSYLIDVIAIYTMDIFSLSLCKERNCVSHPLSMFTDLDIFLILEILFHFSSSRHLIQHIHPEISWLSNKPWYQSFSGVFRFEWLDVDPKPFRNCVWILGWGCPFLCCSMTERPWKSVVGGNVEEGSVLMLAHSTITQFESQMIKVSQGKAVLRACLGNNTRTLNVRLRGTWTRTFELNSWKNSASKGKRPETFDENLIWELVLLPVSTFGTCQPQVLQSTWT